MKLKRIISLLTVIALIPMSSVFAANADVKQEGTDYDLAYMQATVSDGAKLSDKMFYKSNVVRELTTTAKDQFVKYEIDIPQAGDYFISLTANISSQWYVTVDGEKTGGVLNGRSTWNEYRLGTISVNARCKKTITIASNESGVKKLYASHLNITKSSVSYYDASIINNTAVISDNVKSAKIFGMQDYYQAITYRPDAALTATAASTVAGRYIEFSLDIKKGGKYEMLLGYKGSTSNGIYSLVVNGAETDSVIDLYATALDNYKKVANVKLKKGINTIRLVTYGKNSNSKGFACAITGIGFDLKEEITEAQLQASKEEMLLSGLGIIDANNQASDTVSREELSKILCKLTNTSVIPGETYLSDVSYDNKYYGYICSVIRLEYMYGSDYAFYPKNAASLDDVLTAISNILGYRDVVRQKGTSWFAVKNGLLKNTAIKNNDAITYSELYKIIYNSLEVAVSEVLYSKTKDEIKTTISSGYENILSYYLSVYKDDGIINSTEVTSLEGIDGTEKNFVVINSDKYNIGDTDIYNYLGYRVEFYYDASDDNKIKYFECKNNSTVKVSAKNIGSFSNNTLRYFSDGKNTSKNISPGAYMIYNGKSYSAFSDRDIMITNGWLTLIDNNGDEIIDVLNVVSCETYYAVSVFKDKSIVNTKTVSINLDKNSDTVDDVCFIKNGSSASIEDIAAGDIISVAKSRPIRGKSHITVYISSKRIVGEITSVDKDAIYIDDNKYEFNPTFPATSVPNAGTYCELYLDVEGSIAYINTSNVPLNYITGYLVKIGKDSGIRKNTVIKIFDENGVMGLYNTASKIKINDIKASGTNINSDWSEIYDMAAEKAIPQIIMFKLNSEDKINTIITAQSQQNSLLRYAKDKAYDEKDITYLYRLSPKYLVAKPTNTYTAGFVIGDETKSFIIPENKDYDEGYYIAGKEFYQGDAEYSLKAYNVDRKKVPSLIVVNDSVDIHDKDSFGIVKKIVIAGSKSGETYRLTILSANEELTLDADINNNDVINAASTLKCGDVIRFRRHTNAEIIVRLRKVTSLDTASFDYTKISPSNAYAYGFSRILDVYDGVAVMNTPNSDAESIDSTAFTMQAARNIAVFSNGEVRRGSIADIQPGRDVYVRLSYGSVLDLFIVEE